MEIIYKFDTTSENYDKFERCRIDKSLDMALALYDLDNKVRGWRKYDNRESIPVGEISQAFWDILEDHMLNLDDLVD